jgi:hypothetical protein
MHAMVRPDKLASEELGTEDDGPKDHLVCAQACVTHENPSRCLPLVGGERAI